MANNNTADLSLFIPRSVRTLEWCKKIGNGAYGAAYELTVHGVRCVAKETHSVLKDGTDNVVSLKFCQECELLNNLRHPNIVQCFGIHRVAQDDSRILLMEYMHMDLDTCLSKYPNIINPIKFSILCDVSHGLLHLHSQDPPIIHRDLTSTNILLTPDMRAKIADLGMSRIFELQQLQTSKLTKAPGASAYMPPEALTEEPIYDSKLDIFSFGAVALYTGNQEFPLVYEVYPIPTEVVVKKELQVLKRKRWMDKLGSAHPLHPLITRCLLDDPAMRPSTAELCSEMEKLCHEYPWGFENIMKINISDLTVKAQEMEIKHLLSHLSEMEDDMKAKQDDMVKCMQKKDEEMETIRKDYTAVHKQLEDTTQELKSMKKEIEQKFSDEQLKIAKEKMQLQKNFQKEFKQVQIEKEQQQERFEEERKQIKLEMEKKEMQLQKEFTEKLRLLQLEKDQQQKSFRDACRQKQTDAQHKQMYLQKEIERVTRECELLQMRLTHSVQEFQHTLQHITSLYDTEKLALQQENGQAEKQHNELTDKLKCLTQRTAEFEKRNAILEMQAQHHKDDFKKERRERELLAQELAG